MATINSELSVSIAESLTFARLSGDYNPLHLDPVASRRTPFGGTVTHGIQLFLTALNEAAAHGLLTGHGPEALSATFHGPVHSGRPVSLKIERDGSTLHINAETAGRPAFSGVVVLGDRAGSVAGLEDAEFPPEFPWEADFPPAVSEGHVPLRLRRALLATLFPSLSALPWEGWIADLLASTQLVGMRCPGMDSLYSGFQLRRAPFPENAQLNDAQLDATGASLRYRIERVDERFRMVRLKVAGACTSGTLHTFFRPRPVAQPTMVEVMDAVQRNAFAGERALVVGGSRGLGELTAKILAAGSADVLITYAKGSADADRVCREVKALGGPCSSRALDVLSSASAESEWIESSRFTHVYFFASPTISRNTGDWSEALFEQFKRVYVDAFEALVGKIVQCRSAEDAPVRFLYPSSVFVTEAEPGFSEYAAAKAAGEASCDRLEGRRSHFMKPRLPRVRTDQTSSITGSGSPADGLPIMLEVLHAFHL